jgi:YVTN family beta-propeller protein
MAGSADDERDVDVAFGVLGPLRVTRGGAVVPLGGRQQRAVLARLLLSDGGGLSVEQLADALWGEHVPPGASATIQTYVFRLRQAVEPDRERGAPGQVVITDNGRYRLDVPPDGLDATAFERQLAAGQRHLAAGAPADAVTEFDQALTLWRGEVLADLADYEFVQPVAARLSDERMAALEGKFSAELALGRHAEVIGELDELVARFPLNEQLQRLRMIALYRCGRPSDALAAYDRLRRRLADELGADPSPPIQQLHQQLLTHDPALAWQPTDVDRPVATLAGPPSDEAVPDVLRFGPQRVRKPAHPGKRPWWRTRWLILAVVLVVAGAAAGITAIVVSQTPKHTLAAIPPNSVAIIDPNGAMHDAIPVGQSPTALAYGFGSLWVANSGGNTVSRINPKSREEIARITVGHNPGAIAIGANKVWVVNTVDGTVSGIDPITEQAVATPEVGSLPGAIAAGRNGVWVANSGDDTVQRINLSTNNADPPIPVGAKPDGLALAGGSLWVSNGRDGTVLELDSTTGHALGSPIPAGAGAMGLQLSHDALWVADNSGEAVTRIDLRSRRPTATIPVGDGPEGVLDAEGRLWVNTVNDGRVSKFDPASGAPARSFSTGSVIKGMAVVGSTIWVSAQSFASPSHRGGTLTLEATNLPADTLQSLDPPTVYFNPLEVAITPVYDGLLDYRAAGGADSLEVVPDLSMNVPTPADGGRTYTFFVRPGIRYSDGGTVVASDFRRGIERALIVGDPDGRPDFFYGIVGGKNCHDHPALCDLRPGVDADDASGRLTIHLQVADPEFLYKLAFRLVVATPPGVPLTKVWTRPMPGTGPYQVDRFVPNRQLTLVRNPHFRQWSFAAQPAGYPDQLQWLTAPTDQQAAADVLAGRADVYSPPFRLAELVRNLSINYSAQLRTQRTFNLDYITLNTNVPPFDKQSARQAVSYAVDRQQLVKIYGGSSNAAPTCQVLMPGFPGYQWYCPYADASYAPNLDRARALIAASGTSGMKVAIWSANLGLSSNVAQYLKGVLTSLGYRAEVHLFGRPNDPSDADRVFAFLGNPANRLQITLGGGWNADYPDPATFIDDLFGCDAGHGSNRGAYCNPQIDADISLARQTEQGDLVSARAQWRQIERTLVDAVPIVPIINRFDRYLVSTHLGNFLDGPLGLPVLDQMWVR